MKIQRFCTVALALGVAGALVLAGATVIGCDKPQESTRGVGDSHDDHDAGEKVAVMKSKCPIMSDNAVDPKGVSANLVRTFKGKKVGFCCGGCPAAWDKLTGDQRNEKLAAAK